MTWMDEDFTAEDLFLAVVHSPIPRRAIIDQTCLDFAGVLDGCDANSQNFPERVIRQGRAMSVSTGQRIVYYCHRNLPWFDPEDGTRFHSMGQDIGRLMYRHMVDSYTAGHLRSAHMIPSSGPVLSLMPMAVDFHEYLRSAGIEFGLNQETLSLFVARNEDDQVFAIDDDPGRLMYKAMVFAARQGLLADVLHAGLGRILEQSGVELDVARKPLDTVDDAFRIELRFIDRSDRTRVVSLSPSPHHTGDLLNRSEIDTAIKAIEFHRRSSTPPPEISFYQ